MFFGLGHLSHDHHSYIHQSNIGWPRIALPEEEEKDEKEINTRHLLPINPIESLIFSVFCAHAKEKAKAKTQNTNDLFPRVSEEFLPEKKLKHLSFIM